MSLEQSQQAAPKDEIARNKMKRTCEKEGRNPTKIALPVPKALKAAQKRMEDHHSVMKEQSAQLRTPVDNPLFYSLTDPESGFPS